MVFGREFSCFLSSRILSTLLFWFFQGVIQDTVNLMIMQPILIVCLRIYSTQNVGGFYFFFAFFVLLFKNHCCNEGTLLND